MADKRLGNGGAPAGAAGAHSADAPVGGADAFAGATAPAAATAPAGAFAPASPAAPGASARRRARNLAAFGIVAVAWLALDVATKRAFCGFEPGELVAGPFAGVFQLRLVHNTGAAWGMFGDMTLALGVLAVVVCAGLAAFALATACTSSLALEVGLALVFAGGVGNALDRFSLGYVVDFIEPVFIDFPVFNVADIGVTCGVVLVFVALALEWRQGRAL